ncbi:MAG TPA: MBL fold metallo-hydrolase [Actinomycetota bacterium]|nr:MBL fold metallo-hydrolase [Actinomycetota bacterium]
MTPKRVDHRRREPAPGVFRLSLPLPFPGLHQVNAYLLAGEGMTLVDCGLYLPDDDADHGWDHVVAALAAVDVTPEDIDTLVLTHTHIDHFGMAGRLKEESGCRVLYHPNGDRELELLRDPAGFAARLRDTFSSHGVAEEDLDDLTRYEDWRGFVHSLVPPDAALEDGDRFAVGGREWKAIHTPGHSISHLCLWSKDGGLLISGDHLLGSITPHIDFRGGDEDPLGDYLASLEIIEKIEPRIVLPGHGHPFAEGAERARVTARHHERRLGAILQVVRHQACTASQITDAIFGSTLLHFQRRLALGEALAHIRYLQARGEVERVADEDGAVRFRKVSRRPVAEVPE